MASIQGVYVALFGRPADPTGLAYFNAATNNGNDLTKIGDLASTQEYKDRFAGQNNVQIVSAIYQSLFNRAPEATGLNFFVNALNTGSLNINNIAIAILDGAQGSDKTVVDAKIASANTFTARLDTAVEIGTYVGNDAAAQGRAFLAGVTTTPKTAAEADTAITNLNIGNANVALTGADDVVNLTSATATLKTTNSNDTITAAAGNFNAGDRIDGGLGVDTLNVTAAAAAVTPASLVSVEKVYLTQGTAVGGIGFANATGVQEVWNKASTFGVTFTDIASTVALGIENGAVATTFGFKAAEVTGTADAATLNLKSATLGAAVTIDAIETLNIVTSGTAVAGAGSITGTTLKDVKISGDIGGTFTFGAATLKSVDASALNGSGITLDVEAGVTGVKVTGSKFADTITLDTAAGGVATDKDVVVYNAGNISTATQKDVINNFTAGEDKIDLSAFALVGGKAAATTFGAAPVEGASFLGNALGFFGTTLYADTNNDGVYNAATDFQVTLTGAAGIAVADIIFTA